MTGTVQADWLWGEVLAVHDHATVRLRHARADAHLTVEGGRLRAGAGYAAAAPSVRRALARTGAVLRLRGRGRYLVHASGVVDPRGRAWLLLGDSGSGKSTLAYGLRREGWHVLGDDGVVLEIARGRIVAHAWRDPLVVSRELAGEFPELAGGKALDPYDPRERMAVAGPCARRAPVAGLLLLERTAERGLPLERASGPDALLALVRQSPWVALADDASAAHLHALGRIARACAWRLPNGPGRPRSIARDLMELGQ